MARGSTKNLQNFSNIHDFSCFLVDNGSFRAEATLNLRKVARKLGGRLGIAVHPVSLLHSSKVSSEQLEGFQANVLEQSLNDFATFPASSKILILPLFFGPSRALTEFIPNLIDTFSSQNQIAEILLADCLINSDDDSVAIVGQILSDRVHDVYRNLDDFHGNVRVLLVDHGSAVEGVNHVRKLVACELESSIGERLSFLGDCSMEKPKSDLVEITLLDEILTETPPTEPIILAQMFFSNGRHAGAKGDIEKICQAHVQHKTLRAAPILDHPLLIELLARRALEAML